MKTYQALMLVLAVFVVFFFISHVHAQDGVLVSSIKVQGNKRVDESTILYYIKTRAGEPLSRNKISKDIEEIYNLGQFKDIRVETQQTPNGLEVIFVVEEIPSIGDVNLNGNNKINDIDIREKLGLKRGMTFQQHMIKEAKEQVKLLYHQKGFFFAEINVDSEKATESFMNVNIRIREGKKVRIGEIRFVGNKSIPTDDLRDQMETDEETWMSFLDDSGIYNRDTLRLDTFRLEGYYHDHGYIRVRVMEPKIDVNRKNKEKRGGKKKGT